MKTTLPKNWIAKLLFLLLAVAIWFLIKDHLNETGGKPAVPPPMIVVPEPGTK